MSNAWQSIISGGIVAIFAFALAFVWDIARFRRDQRQRDRAVLQCALAEIDTLLGILLNDLNLVEAELQLFSSEQGYLVNPLDPVTSGFWELVKLHTPQVLLGDAELLSKMVDAARRTEQVAQLIRSREAFRVSNQALSTFKRQMGNYDHLLQDFIRQLIDVLQELKGRLVTAV